jgi:hypothetical protein
LPLPSRKRKRQRKRERYQAHYYAVHIISVIAAWSTKWAKDLEHYQNKSGRSLERPLFIQVF